MLESDDESSESDEESFEDEDVDELEDEGVVVLCGILRNTSEWLSSVTESRFLFLPVSEFGLYLTLRRRFKIIREDEWVKHTQVDHFRE